MDQMQILVVEDEPKMARLLSEGLTEEGYHVLVAHDGREGLELARAQGLDVVVLDLMLPGMGRVGHRTDFEKGREPHPYLDADGSRRR
jgi:DNA-binding response OmpR family regulator